LPIEKPLVSHSAAIFFLERRQQSTQFRMEKLFCAPPAMTAADALLFGDCKILLGQSTISSAAVVVAVAFIDKLFTQKQS